MNTTAELTFVDSVAKVTFIPPDERKPPSMDYPLFDTLSGFIDQVEQRRKTGECRVLLFTSRSEKTFLAGANIAVLETLNETTIAEWVERGHQLLNRIDRLPIPSIVRLKGYALGGGLEFAMACDFIYAEDDAKVGQTEAKLGFVTGWGGSGRLIGRVGVSRAKELLTSGRILEADEAYQYGILDFIGTSEQVDQRIEAYIAANGDCSPAAVAEMKRIVSGFLPDPDRVLEMERESSIRVMHEGDTLKRVHAFLHKRKK